VVTNSKGYLELNLNGRDLRAIPPETLQLTATHVLRLAHNYIDCLPLMIAYLRLLKVLDLQHNLLPSLPETLVNCRQLSELYLTANRLSELPKSIGGLKNLRVLAIGENQFEQLPQEVGLMTSLRILDIHGNKLWHLPFSLQELKHLTQLNASDNLFDHVPLVITKITSLQKLNLAKNRLASLPVDFNALRGLQELNLSHNSFVSISSLLTSFKHLKYLSLANNRLKFLPPQMSHLQNLRVLHVQHNCLRHVPARLRCLQFYNVSSNQLTSFSVEGMRNLVSLSASRNNLGTVPRGLYKLKKLKFLYLDNNQLVELHEDIRQLKELRVLDVSNNQLVALPRCLHKLAKLQGFNAKGNYKLRQTELENEESNNSTLDSASLRHKTQCTVEGATNQQNKRDEHNETANIESKTNEFTNDVLDSNDITEKTGSNSKRKQFVTISLNKETEHGLAQMSKVPSDLEIYAKAAHGHTTCHHNFKSPGMPSAKVDGKLHKERTYTRSSLPRESETKAPTKVSSLQYLRHLLFGVPKKPNYVKSNVSNSVPDSHRLSEKSIHFQDNEMSPRCRGSRNFPPTRQSTLSRNYSCLGSQRKPTWARSFGPYGHVHEPIVTNRIHFNIPDERRDDMDADSDSHGYGTWGSRHRPPDGYFDTDSLDYTGSSSYGGGDCIQPPPSVGYNGAFTPGHGDYNAAVSGPNVDFYFSDDNSGEEGGARNKKCNHHHTNKNIQQCHNYNDIKGGWREGQYLQCGCHCSSSNKIHALGKERSSSQRRRNSFDRISSKSAFMSTKDMSSFVSEANAKAMGRQGDSRSQGLISQSYTTLHTSVPEPTLVNSNKRMTIPQVGCWFRDGRVSSPTCFNKHIGQCHGHSCPQDNPYHCVYHGETGEPSRSYQNNPSSDADQANSSQNHQSCTYRTPSSQRLDRSVRKNRSKSEAQSELYHGETLKKNTIEFDHVLKTSDSTGYEIKQNVKAAQINDTSTSCVHGPGHQNSNLGDKFSKGRKLNPPLSHSRSVDSLMDLTSRGDSVRKKSATSRGDIVGGSNPPGLVGGLGELNLAHSDEAQTAGEVHRGGTDYNLLGVCSQVETLLNQNLLQPVISYQHRGRHSFAEKTIRENTHGLWRMDSRSDFAFSDVNGDDFGGGGGGGSDEDEDDLLALEYTQRQTFTVTSQGGQFVSSAGPEVKISVPAHATADPLRITVQLMFVPSSVLAKAKELNYFVNNIVAMGPVVYFRSSTEAKLNSAATVTIPAPAEVKGGHLTVLTVRQDHSCIPCSSGYRSGKLAASLTTWQFAGKVAVVTQARCKYKACKSMEQLLQCLGEAQI
ncbi:unnamed protein product, partial [Candidula unifasciata]